MYARLFKIDKGYIFYIILVISALSYLIANMIITNHSDAISRGVYYIAGLWMGFMFYSFCVLLIYFVIDLATPITSKLLGIIILLGVLSILIYGVFNAEKLTVKEINIQTSKNADLRVVQFSDMHLGAVYGKDRLNDVVVKINELKPDVVVITGDLIDGKYNYDKSIFQLLNNITADIYLVSGNHEQYAGFALVEDLLKGTKVKWLRDEVIEYHGIQLIGLSDSGDKLKVNMMLESMNVSTKLDSDKYKILLYHRPTGWKDASKYVDLMLSGHTHAGQIWPFKYLSWIEAHAAHGVYRIDGGEFMLYVSPGTGGWGPPMRIGSHPEITVFNIQKQ